MDGAMNLIHVVIVQLKWVQSLAVSNGFCAGSYNFLKK